MGKLLIFAFAFFIFSGCSTYNAPNPAYVGPNRVFDLNRPLDRAFLEKGRIVGTVIVQR